MEYDASVKRASTDGADERTANRQQQHVVNDGTDDLRCIAASSYAAAGYCRRAVSIARPEHLPAVIENTVKVRRSGWMAALQMASCIQATSTPLTTTTKWSLRDGTRSGSMAPLIAVCSAMDWACRAQPTRMYFDTMLPSVAATVVSWATAQNHVHSSDPHVRLTDRAEVEMLMSKLTRVAQPHAHWQEVLLVFKEYVKGAAAGATGAPVAETAVAETAVGEGSECNASNTPKGEAGVNRSAGYHQRQGDDTKDSSSSSTPTGRVMHVLLLADRWQEALQVFEHTPHKMRNAHTSSRNYLLTAISKKLAAGAEEMLPALSTSPPPHNLPECALADIVERDYHALRDAYVSQQPKNHFTHVTFVRALCECTHLVGCGSDEIQHALRALQHSPRARRCAEDTALHASFGGSWQTAVFLYMLQGDAQHSRYLGPIAIAACAQQYHEQQCAMLLTHLCTRSSQSLSRKQLTMCCAAMVACGVWGQATPSSNTSHPASGASSTALESTSVLTDAIRRHQLIGSQEDYDAFAAQFLEYLSSAVLHRSRAAEISHESCPSTLQRIADESEDVRKRRVAGEKDRAWRAMCIAATRRRRTAEAITNPEHLMGNLVALLEVPPKLSHIAATAELRSTYRHKADYYSGSMSVGWIAALQILNAAAQVGGKGDGGGGGETASWSTASLPTLLMDLGFHQNTVMACL
ncbi:Hypothetical protein, putative [Bodo saltans]|uniref:Uncharacterized protein n=1 Tax=Bodo saltans TaxID=75058 RepID=A0A0S4JFZ5_BODSA|nr:Hypothetical protein, putative [Bodo saltans]|eukprot:CUG90467.1 Hypothetical protein, putative [Bodo saltans]